MQKPTEADYFDSDFNVEELKQSLVIELPPITVYEKIKAHSWDQFYQKHNRGNVYKPRRYLLQEFANYLQRQDVKCILEVGCGYGCSCYPILEKVRATYVATDYSPNSLQIFQNHPNFTSYHVSCLVWDITQDTIPQELFYTPPTIVLSIFTLSAIHPSQHKQCLQNIYQVMTQQASSSTSTSISSSSVSMSSFLLFRDYGEYDMTMLRHEQRIEEKTYVRKEDGTLCYYFTLDYLQRLMEEIGFVVKELKYATVINKNRKTKENMHRIFVHGVFEAIVPLRK